MVPCPVTELSKPSPKGCDTAIHGTDDRTGPISQENGLYHDFQDRAGWVLLGANTMKEAYYLRTLVDDIHRNGYQCRVSIDENRVEVFLPIERNKDFPPPAERSVS